MKNLQKRLLFWAPRALCLLFAAFISLFALDVFEEHRGVWQTIGALAMHLVPTAVILVTLAIAWRWEWVGGLVFSGLGAWYLITAGGRVHWSACACIAGPLFLVGGLFLANWFHRGELRAKPS
jgi:hypothetical protein